MEIFAIFEQLLSFLPAFVISWELSEYLYSDDAELAKCCRGNTEPLIGELTIRNSRGKDRDR